MKHKSLILAALILLSGCNINSAKESSINKSIDAYIEEIYEKVRAATLTFYFFSF